jgi:hypothetical protein
MIQTALIARCIYCGWPLTRTRGGEHVLAAAIGGRLTISDVCRGRNVCGTCNNTILSELDVELCMRSPLSVIAAEELDRFILQDWDVDREDGNLLLEGKRDFKAGSIKLYPQMVVETQGFQIRGDYEEMKRFGLEQYQRVFVENVRGAFATYKAGGRNRLNLYRVHENRSLLGGYRYPPRVFARKPIEQFKRGMSFELRYLHKEDKERVLSLLEGWDSAASFSSPEVRLSGELPITRCVFDNGKVLRALAKIGVNLLAAFCPNTPVGREHFDLATKVVMGELSVGGGLRSSIGFIHAADIEPIKVAGGHSFRLLYMFDHWHVFMSFFGGRIGAFAHLPGPNNEDWQCADITMPVGVKTYSMKPLPLLQPLNVHVEWLDLAKVMPSVEMLNVKVETHGFTAGKTA